MVSSDGGELVIKDVNLEIGISENISDLSFKGDGIGTFKVKDLSQYKNNYDINGYKRVSIQGKAGEVVISDSSEIKFEGDSSSITIDRGDIEITQTGPDNIVAYVTTACYGIINGGLRTEVSQGNMAEDGAYNDLSVSSYEFKVMGWEGVWSEEKKFIIDKSIIEVPQEKFMNEKSRLVCSLQKKIEINGFTPGVIEIIDTLGGDNLLLKGKVSKLILRNPNIKLSLLEGATTVTEGHGEAYYYRNNIQDCIKGLVFSQLGYDVSSPRVYTILAGNGIRTAYIGNNKAIDISIGGESQGPDMESIN